MINYINLHSTNNHWKYARIRVFSDSYIAEKGMYRSEETLILAYFTQWTFVDLWKICGCAYLEKYRFLISKQDFFQSLKVVFIQILPFSFILIDFTG